jgi:hypothetical protein
LEFQTWGELVVGFQNDLIVEELVVDFQKDTAPAEGFQKVEVVDFRALLWLAEVAAAASDEAWLLVEWAEHTDEYPGSDFDPGH